MTGARKLVALAGVATVMVGGWTLLDVSPAVATENPPASEAASHGQPVARTGARRTAAGPVSHGASSTPAHGATNTTNSTGTAGTHTTGHGATAPQTPTANAHAPEHADAAGSTDELASTYFGPTPDADTALMVLRDGNGRWVTGHTQNPRTDESDRRQTAENGQHPFATILTCADSRIPVERVFDRGVGELFVVRVAGNVVAETEAGTIEYGVEHLHTPVIVVMGHSQCGAVKAACDGGEAHGNVRFLIGEIEPAVRRARSMNPEVEGEALVAAAVRENVMQSMFDLLASSDTLRSAVDGGSVRLVGAVYDIATGEVDWIGEHPWQDGLISVMNNRASGTARDHATAEATGGRDGH